MSNAAIFVPSKKTLGEKKEVQELLGTLIPDLVVVKEGSNTFQFAINLLY